MYMRNSFILNLFPEKAHPQRDTTKNTTKPKITAINQKKKKKIIVTDTNTLGTVNTQHWR